MPGVQVSPTRVDPDQARISVPQAFGVWAATWIVGNLLGAAVVAATGYSSTTEAPVWVSMVLAATLWTPMLIGLWLLSDRLDARPFADEYGLRFKLVDLIGNIKAGQQTIHDIFEDAGHVIKVSISLLLARSHEIKERRGGFIDAQDYRRLKIEN